MIFIKPNDPILINIIKSGGVIAYPTEAVYGLGCDPENPKAIERILEMKRRSKEKGLILIASAFEQLEMYTEKLPSERLAIVQATWPGPFSWLFPISPKVSPWVCGQHKTIAVRVTNHPIAKQICEILGHALVSTSANREGQPPARTATEVFEIFGHEIDAIVEGPIGESAQPTEIRNALTHELIRKG